MLLVTNLLVDNMGGEKIFFTLADKSKTKTRSH